jgi:8-oxo-dGTP diphosphatase
MTTVAAALIEKDGRILICQRRGDRDHAGKWEFPGGKVEAGEAPQDALIRELREELSIEASIGDEVTRYEYGYPGRKPIQLVFYRVAKFSGELDYGHFAAAAWARPAELPAYDFLEGDVEFVRKLAQGTYR